MSKHVSMAEKPETHTHEHEHEHENALAPVGTHGTETEKGSSRYASSEAGVAHKAETTRAERRLVRKLGAFLSISRRVVFATVDDPLPLSPLRERG